MNGWPNDRFNDGVAFDLSSLADPPSDHLEFGTFPRDGNPSGLVVYVPSAEYLRALKLRAMRVLDPVRGDLERIDIPNLMQVVGISSTEGAIGLLGRYGECGVCRKQQFLLQNMSREGLIDAPKYPR